MRPPSDDDAAVERRSLDDLLPPDTLLVLPDEARLEAELRRTWDDAAHHIELARRRGEDVVARDELLRPPDELLGRLRAFARIAVTDQADEAGVVVFPIRPPESIDRDIRLLRRVVRDGMPTVILCDNAGQAERLEELLNEDGGWPSPAALSIGVLNGGFVLPPAEGARTGQKAPAPAPGDPLGTGLSMLAAGGGLRLLTDHEIFRRERRLRRARRYVTAAALDAATALRPGDYVVHLEHGVGIYRGMERIFVRESTIEVAVIEYEGGDRLNVPLYRIDQIERYRAGGDVSEDAPPPRLHRLGGKRWSAAARQDAGGHPRDDRGTAATSTRAASSPSRPPHVPDTAWQTPARSRRSCSRTRPTSARRPAT